MLSDNYRRLMYTFPRSVYQSDAEFESEFGDPTEWTFLESGGENEVYVTPDEKHVIKKALEESSASSNSSNNSTLDGSDSERLARFEVELMLPLRHANITRTIAVSPSYTADLKRTGTLTDHIASHSCPSLRERLRLCKNVSVGLLTVHAHNVLHLDMKPENIFMNGRVATIGDFGSAVPVTANQLGATPGWTPGHISEKRGKEIDAYSACFIVIGILAWSENVLHQCSHLYRLLDATTDIKAHCKVLQGIFTDTCFFPANDEGSKLVEVLRALHDGILGRECGKEELTAWSLINSIEMAVSAIR